jgi:hypothetical protein
VLTSIHSHNSILLYSFQLVCLGCFSFSVITNIIVFIILRRFNLYVGTDVALKDDRYLVFVLRVLREETIVAQSIDYIARCVDGVKNVSVIIVGTERERNDLGLNPTLERARAAIANLSQFMVVEAPAGRNGTHAHQTNYALRFINTNSHNTWTFTLDIDSQFGRRALYAAVEAINADVDIIQQHALFLSNYQRLSTLHRAHAIYQSAWTIRHEMKRVYLNLSIGISLAHVVGHGLCIRLSKLCEYGGFPEETPFEDINLGFYLISSGETIHSLPVFELGDNPVTLRDGFRQEYSWSYAAMLYFRYLRHFRSKCPTKFSEHRSRALVLASVGTWTYIRWLIGSWFSVLLLGFAILGDWVAIATVAAVSCEYTQCALRFHSLRLLTNIELALSPFYVLLGILRRSIPADKAFIDWMAFRTVTKHKTPH